MLYLRGAADRADGVFNTAALPGVPQLDIRDFDKGLAAEAPLVSSQDRELRGAPVRPYDDSKLRKKEKKAIKGETLDKWFGMPKAKMTPELEAELKAIKMRGALDAKRFYKGNDSRELPTHFHMATEVGGGMAAA